MEGLLWSEPRTINVESAAVSVCGGIQPSTLRRAIGREHRENGLLARFLLVWPPTRKKRWTDEDVSSDVVEEMTDVVRKLHGLDFALDRNGEPVAGLAGLSGEAKSLFQAFYDEHAAEQETLDEDLAAAWSKLEEYAARLALIIHLTRLVSGESVEAHEVDAESMAAGIALTRWFCEETRRAYALLEQSDVERQRDDLVSWIRRRGCDVSVPDVQGGHRRFKTAAETEAALDELVKAGFGHWQQVASSHRGGRPTRRFILHGE